MPLQANSRSQKTLKYTPSESTKSLKNWHVRARFPRAVAGLPGSFRQCSVCHGGAIRAMQGECTGQNKEHGRHSLVVYHRRWDAASTDEWRCFKRGEKNTIFSRKDKFVADYITLGFHCPVISKFSEIKLMKTYFLLEQPAFRTETVLQHPTMKSPCPQHTQTNQSLLASRTGPHIARISKADNSFLWVF